MPYEFTEWEQEPEAQAHPGIRLSRRANSSGVRVLDPPVPPKKHLARFPASQLHCYCGWLPDLCCWLWFPRFSACCSYIASKIEQRLRPSSPMAASILLRWPLCTKHFGPYLRYCAGLLMREAPRGPQSASGSLELQRGLVQPLLDLSLCDSSFTLSFSSPSVFLICILLVNTIVGEIETVFAQLRFIFEQRLD